MALPPWAESTWLENHADAFDEGRVQVWVHPADRFERWVLQAVVAYLVLDVGVDPEVPRDSVRVHVMGWPSHPRPRG
jgi:hypothetical protein